MRARKSLRGFTLIELMVVIGIIGLLVAIALPALNAARVAAKRAATEATISVLGTGLEMFHGDTAIGGNYPPSIRVGSKVHANGIAAKDPFASNKTVDVGGATLLVWALAGADLLGSPGFRDLDNDATGDPFGGWLSDTHNGINGLYQIYTSSNAPTTSQVGKPAVPRAKPYVDMAKVKLAKQISNTSNYQIPAATAPNTLQTQGNVFLDNFDQPILYYKANPTALGWIAAGSTGMDPLGTALAGGTAGAYGIQVNGSSQRYIPTGVYNLLDNSIFTGNVSPDGIDLGAGTGHPLRALGNSDNQTPPKWTPAGSLGYQIRNPNITNVFQAHNNDSFILLSAGNDGLFGTADDIANFPINK